MNGLKLAHVYLHCLSFIATLYISLNIDRRLNWKHHDKQKVEQIRLKEPEMSARLLYNLFGQNNFPRIITDAYLYLTNKKLHEDLKWISELTCDDATKHKQWLAKRINVEVIPKSLDLTNN